MYNSGIPTLYKYRPKQSHKILIRQLCTKACYGEESDVAAFVMSDENYN